MGKRLDFLQFASCVANKFGYIILITTKLNYIYLLFIFLPSVKRVIVLGNWDKIKCETITHIWEHHTQAAQKTKAG